MRSRWEKLFVSLLLGGCALVGACAAHADTWSASQLTTYAQDEWGAPNSAANTLLENNYNSLYASNGDALIIGAPSSGFFIEFTGPARLSDYLPADGTPSVLNASVADPVRTILSSGTSSGAFGGEVTALRLNVDFSAAGLLPGTLKIPFGDLIVTNLDGNLAPLNNLTIAAILGDANACLGGVSCAVDVQDLDVLVADINNAFDGGVQLFATDHLIAPSTVPAPEPSSLLLLVLGVGGVLAMGARWRSPAFRSEGRA